ncbi:LysR family transcriptional regulator [uncultured Hydrogenophaga sp.]|uniref:LysR family transcriptional regulator n=1 Tax=uncultured Hydrogenophaga sp. TaxID=199683 RepID=UPI0025895D6F|nr:LysR family transcriptional regulator [uncultured Hydrogenophaga sp.]
MRHTPTVKQLRAFAAVYRSGKVATAAAELSLTQSAVSALVRQLEGKLGVALFDRTTRALHRTAAADHLIATAERLLGELDGLARDAQALEEHQAGKIRVAVTLAVAQSLMPRALARFQREQPQTRVQLEDCAPDQFVAAIVGERADFGIGVMESEHPELVSEVLLRDQLCLLCHAGHSLASAGKALRWKGLAGQPLIVVRPGYGSRRAIERAAAVAGIELQIVHEVSLLATAVAMAREGLGAAIVPASMAAEARRGADLVARRLIAPTVSRDISVVSKKGHTLGAAARRFLALVA